MVLLPPCHTDILLAVPTTATTALGSELEKEIHQLKKNPRPKAKSSAPTTTAAHEAPPEKPKVYSVEIQKIISCESYYEVLQVEQDANEGDLKKSYRRVLASLFLSLSGSWRPSPLPFLLLLHLHIHLLLLLCHLARLAVSSR